MKARELHLAVDAVGDMPRQRGLAGAGIAEQPEHVRRAFGLRHQTATAFNALFLLRRPGLHPLEIGTFHRTSPRKKMLRRDIEENRRPDKASGLHRLSRENLPMTALHIESTSGIRTATNTGGRNGHSETDDGSVSVYLSVRKGMGGPGTPGTTTPEHLFAAGHAACFRAAATSWPRTQVKIPDARITYKVDVGLRDGGGFASP